MNKQQEIEKMVLLLDKANTAYRTGDLAWFENQGLIAPTDREFDELLERLAVLDPTNEILVKVGYEVADDSRKQSLPVQMLSADKVKALDEIHKWMSRNNIPPDAFVILSPKLDGISLLVNEAHMSEMEHRMAWTRGDGAVGQVSDAHFAAVEAKSNLSYSFYSKGEALISRSNWKKHFEGRISPYNNKPYMNSRNTTAGMFNAPVPRKELQYVDYIRYGIESFDGEQLDKTKQFDLANNLNTVQLHTRSVKLRDLTVELLEQLYTRWSVDYEIDGIIIDVDNAELRHHLGTHVSGKYPAFMVAYKGDNEEVKETQVNKIILQISKQGLAKPVLLVDPINLDGAVVRRVTGNNIKFLLDNKIATGAAIKLKRSGFVVPKIVEVTKVATGWYEYLFGLKCPVCDSEVTWSDKENLVDMACVNPECPGREYKTLLSFFKTLDVENVGPGVVEALYNAGYTKVKQVLQLTEEDLLKIEGFQKRKAQIVHSSIAAKVANIGISKLQHASNMFSGLGSRKLQVINQFIAGKSGSAITRAELLQLEGFAATSASVYMDNIGRFFAWVDDLELGSVIDYSDGIVIKKVDNMKNTLEGKQVCFTGFRDADLEDAITDHGGGMKSGISKNAHILVMKQTGSGSSKEKKAEALGLEILSREDFMEKYIT